MADSMDVDMDIDFEYEDPGIARLNAEAAALEAQQREAAAAAGDAMNGVEEAREEGEVDTNAPVPKVHIMGVDNLSTNDIRNFAQEHYDMDLFKKVEWVNDSSANLVYDTPEAAAEALQAFSAEEVAEPLQVRAAKRLTTHPDVELSARQAVEGDQKVKNAHVYSTYYLRADGIDPENPHGGRNRKRRYDGDRAGGRGYRSRDYDYKRPRRGEREQIDRYSRRSSGDEAFDVDLYDDNPEALAKRRTSQTSRQGSYSSGDSRREDSRREDSRRNSGRRPSRLNNELLPERSNGRLRDRSASPGRSNSASGLYGFAEEGPRRQTARPRSPTPPGKRAALNNHGAKELFPGKSRTTTDAPMDLFQNQSSPSKGSGSRELFPNHKRQDAVDLDREARRVAQIGEGLENGISTGEPRDMFSRIGIKVDQTSGRLNGDEYSFKGAGGSVGGGSGGGNGSAGFSILGASKERAENPLIKELFPMKSGGGAKDLFDGKIKGRGNQRRKAEDLM